MLKETDFTKNEATTNLRVQELQVVILVVSGIIPHIILISTATSPS